MRLGLGFYRGHHLVHRSVYRFYSTMADSSPATTGTQTPTTTSKSSLKREAKRLEKEAKLAAKSLNAVASAVASDKKVKEKEKKEREKEDDYVDDTPKGEKKDMSTPMSQSYNPLAVEAAWYDWWFAQGFFKPEYVNPSRKKNNKEPFVIPSPPPNVTGSLHIGHALTVAIQDGLVRWYRMLGHPTLFVPGFDHAGISTQSVVEKRLWRKEGKTRHDVGREEFLRSVWGWKEEYQERITNQLRRLGGSYDWDRVAFTMNDKLSKAVVETFCRLHEGGIIYRANRLVNWCVRLNTTLSNLEVEQKELEGRTFLSIPGYDPKEKFEFGVITSFAYQIEDSDERIVIATTRPETMLGDTAIAVHPDDPRYKHLHGKFATHPFVSRRLPIITDSIAVDPTFGTGAVKITPAHDPADYDVGKRHNLPFVSILRDDGTLVDDEEVVGKWRGMKRFHVRVGIVEELKRVGLYVGVEENKMNVPICAKSGDVIEPVVKPQWWVDCGRLRGEVVRRTREGEMKVAPRQSESEWYRWLEGIQDWCVSRQLWWGHRIPAYYVKVKGEEKQDEDGDGKIWVVGRTPEEAEEKARKLVGEGQEFELEQDQDVLDTWFSSGLWPFSTLGWPDDHSGDLKRYYPTSLLETGWDILFFWVARMCLLGVYLTGEMPFREVYCHAMIRDAHGRKMSKSLGNVIDPIDVIHGVPLETLHSKLEEGNLDEKEITKAKAGQKKDFPRGIPQCGTDALRFALCAYSGGGRDINLDILRVEGYRKFCNKVFNATRFAMLKLEGGYEVREEAKPTGKESLVEQWILNKLDVAASEVNKYLAERNFMAATNSVYNFWLYELCDVYIEAMKPMTDDTAPPEVRKSAQDTLYLCLDYGLRLLHPFMPYVTEELWQRLPRRKGDLTPSIMVSEFPLHDDDFLFEEATKKFDLVFSTLKTGRSLAASYTLQSDIQFFIQVQTEEEQALFSSQVPTIVALTKGCKSATVVRDPSQIPAGCGSAVVTPTMIIHTLVLGLVDLEKEIAKCDKKLDLARLNLQKIMKVISQPDYESTVPENVRMVNEEKKKTSEAEISTLVTSRNMFTQLQ